MRARRGRGGSGGSLARMYEPLESDDLHVSEDLRYERAAGAVERAARVGLGFIILMALAGFFGSGPISTGTAFGGPARVHYERFARLDTPIALRVSLEAATRDTVAVWMPLAYAEAMRTIAVMPEPAAVQVAGGYVRYAFLSLPGEPFSARFDVRPRVVGRVAGVLRAETAEEAHFRQFVYP